MTRATKKQATSQGGISTASNKYPQIPAYLFARTTNCDTPSHRITLRRSRVVLTYTRQMVDHSAALRDIRGIADIIATGSN
jgi:hypothetical protein